MRRATNSPKIKLCNDIWINVFEWADRAKLGLTLALINARFDSLVDQHFSVKERQIQRKRGPLRPRGTSMAICWKISDIEGKIVELKEAFLNATLAHRHIILLWIAAGTCAMPLQEPHFQVENAVGERLTLRQFEGPFYSLKRCPIEWDDDAQ